MNVSTFPAAVRVRLVFTGNLIGSLTFAELLLVELTFRISQVHPGFHTIKGVPRKKKKQANELESLFDLIMQIR